MVHVFEADAKLLASLGEIDLGLMVKVREAGCPHCRGPLDRADYPRKPRGCPCEAEEGYGRRMSLCCRREGCRRRATPPSVRFLGRKVYIALVVVVASMVGRTAGHGRRRQVEGVPVRTVRRWLDWWTLTFALSVFWREARGLLSSPVEEGSLPGSLLARLGAGWAAVTGLLRLIAPVTTTSVRARIAMPM